MQEQEQQQMRRYEEMKAQAQVNNRVQSPHIHRFEPGEEAPWVERQRLLKKLRQVVMLESKCKSDTIWVGASVYRALLLLAVDQHDAFGSDLIYDRRAPQRLIFQGHRVIESAPHRGDEIFVIPSAALPESQPEAAPVVNLPTFGYVEMLDDQPRPWRWPRRLKRWWRHVRFKRHCSTHTLGGDPGCVSCRWRRRYEQITVLPTAAG